MIKVTFTSGRDPYEGGIDYSADGSYLIPRDLNTWQAVIYAIETGGDPTQIAPLPDLRIK